MMHDLLRKFRTIEGNRSYEGLQAVAGFRTFLATVAVITFLSGVIYSGILPMDAWPMVWTVTLTFSVLFGLVAGLSVAASHILHMEYDFTGPRITAHVYGVVHDWFVSEPVYLYTAELRRVGDTTLWQEKDGRIPNDLDQNRLNCNALRAALKQNVTHRQLD
jgi:hypothetical protein